MKDKLKQIVAMNLARTWVRWVAVFSLIGTVLAAPFALRPREPGLTRHADETLVILTPHNETIRHEFSRAFAEHMLAKNNKKVRIDWRAIGGTSDISRFVDSSFEAAFEHHWRRELKKDWRAPGTPGLVAVSKEQPDDSPHDDTQVEAARREFLNSEVGIGVDLMFGGGTYPFERHGAQGHLVKSGIFEKHPEWFEEDVIPMKASGELLYDPNHLWVGSCLSSFGICYNQDWIERLDMKPPTQWEDLGDPLLAGTIALADPTKSGSATKAFEMLIQEQLALTVDAVNYEEEVDPEQAYKKALDEGWTNALNLIQRIAGNARYFTDYSPKIPHDVAQGNAAAGMCIDFYGRTLNQQLMRPDGTSRLKFVIPKGGTSIGADPFAMFRGAPHKELALDFMEFVLSPAGQRLWHYKKDAPFGPKEQALRRMPIRKDAYDPAELVHSSDPDARPYDKAEAFMYHPEWTGDQFQVIQFLIQVMCLETHEELKLAWEALIQANFPPRAKEIFFDVSYLGYTNVTGELSQNILEGDPLTVQKRRRDLRENFRKNYILAATKARLGE